MALTSSNLYSESFTILKDFINTNISDPKNRYKKQWVHATMPNIVDKDFDGYPFVVIDVDVSEDNQSLDRSTSNKIFRALLTVMSNEPTEVDSIADEIHNKFKDETLTDSLKDFRSISLSSSPFDFEIIGGKKIARRVIGLLGMKRI